MALKVFEFWRDETGVHTTVPWLVKHHSPTGFEWGYGGSGPADLALNIIEYVLRETGYDGPTTNDTWDGTETFQAAHDLHQDFKWQFIARMDRNQHYMLRFDEVKAWVYANLPE